MSKISLAPDASGTGIFTIASPNSNTNRTLTLPDDTGTIVTNSGNQAGSFTTLAASSTATFAAGAVGTPAITTTGDTNTGIFFPAADTIAFAEGGAEAMRIDSSGNLNIGTNSSFGGKISILKTPGTAFSDSSIAVTDGSNVTLYIGNTSTTASSIWTSDLLSFGTGADAFTERARITSGGYFKASNSANYVSSTGAYHELSNDANSRSLFVVGSSTSLTTDGILRIDSSRNTTDNTYYALTYYHGGTGTFKFRIADSGNATNTNNSYGAISDVKLKQDIVDAGSQWDDIKGLRVRKYRWKSDPDGFMQMGLVAQEAELVSPGLIDEHPDYEEVEVPVLDDEGNPVLNEDGTPQVTKERNALGTTTKAVKYSVLYMKAVKALQEAMERIETLEASNTALEARIAALETGA
jgi:hypothetical protein